jgi:hypothetical protein
MLVKAGKLKEVIMTDATMFRLPLILSRAGAENDSRLTARLEFKLPLICVTPFSVIRPLTSEKLTSPDIMLHSARSSASDWLVIVTSVHASMN